MLYSLSLLALFYIFSLEHDGSSVLPSLLEQVKYIPFDLVAKAYFTLVDQCHLSPGTSHRPSMHLVVDLDALCNSGKELKLHQCVSKDAND
jgi:hypothetical protein